jgi:Lon protease-like protein
MADERADEATAVPPRPVSMPMFPLGTALVPFQLLPLQVFEPRYRRLVEDCLAGDSRLGVVLIVRGSEVGGGDVRFDIGTVARILDSAELGDGRIGLATAGETRLRVREWLPDAPYPQAVVEVLPDPAAGAAELAAREPLAAAFGRNVELARALGAEVPDDLTNADDPIRAAWEATAMAPIGPLDVVAILREDDPVVRIERVVAALADAAELLELRLR